MPKFAQDIQIKLNKTAIEMQKLMSMKDRSAWIKFSNAHVHSRLSLRNILKLWRISGESASDFIARIEREANE